MDAIVIEKMLDAPIDRVWQAWTDSKQVAPWFALKANVRAERGAPYELFWDPGHPERQSTLGCRVTFVQPRRWLGFSWRGPSHFDDLMNETAPEPPPPTHVTVGFDSEGNRTRIRVTHGGWGDGARWAEARAWHERTWAGVLMNLEAFVQGRPLPIDWSQRPDS